MKPDWQDMLREIEVGDRVEITYWNSPPRRGTVQKFRKFDKTGCYVKIDDVAPVSWNTGAVALSIRKLTLLELLAEAAHGD
jgi:hypothetical protein